MLVHFDTGALSQEGGSLNDEGYGSTGSSHRMVNKKLEAALSKQQEADAKVSTLEEKLKQFEAENSALKEKVMMYFLCWS